MTLTATPTHAGLPTITRVLQANRDRLAPLDDNPTTAARVIEMAANGAMVAALQAIPDTVDPSRADPIHLHDLTSRLVQAMSLWPALAYDHGVRPTDLLHWVEWSRLCLGDIGHRDGRVIPADHPEGPCILGCCPGNLVAAR